MSEKTNLERSIEAATRSVAAQAEAIRRFGAALGAAWSKRLRDAAGHVRQPPQ